ncbi:hypothetical protein V6N12_048966 [Hibiscus sabdariffa]|uniref:Uncharacterized protein n=1 Tax=Hibiscus sabdariffa TaxID=183260 RepID=A0ABR2EIU5_9ROSI
MPDDCSFKAMWILNNLNAIDFSSCLYHFQESPERQKMMEFQKSLLAFKEKERLLHAIARIQLHLHTT